MDGSVSIFWLYVYIFVALNALFLTIWTWSSLFFPIRTLLFAEEFRVEVLGSLVSSDATKFKALGEGWCFVHNFLRHGIIHIELWFISKSQRVLVASSWHAAAKGKLLQSNEVSNSALCSDRQTVAPFKVEGKEQSTLRQQCSCRRVVATKAAAFHLLLLVNNAHDRLSPTLNFILCKKKRITCVRYSNQVISKKDSTKAHMR